MKQIYSLLDGSVKTIKAAFKNISRIADKECQKRVWIHDEGPE